MSAYKLDVKIQTAAIDEISGAALPQIPDDLPADPAAAVPILDGLLIGAVNPDLALLSDAMYRLQTTHREWGNLNAKIRDRDARDLSMPIGNSLKLWPVMLLVTF